MSVFGSRSKAVLETLHKDLQRVLIISIQRSRVDFGLHDGGRTIEDQQTYFDTGKSRINPKDYATPQALAEKAKHIVIAGDPLYEKSRAVDLHVSEKYKGSSLAWDDVHLSFIAGVITSVSEELYDAGLIEHVVRWGGDWNSDGVIALGQRLKDLPHFELIKPAE